MSQVQKKRILERLEGGGGGGGATDTNVDDIVYRDSDGVMEETVAHAGDDPQQQQMLVPPVAVSVAEEGIPPAAPGTAAVNIDTTNTNTNTMAAEAALGPVAAAGTVPVAATALALVVLEKGSHVVAASTTTTIAAAADVQAAVATAAAAAASASASAATTTTGNVDTKDVLAFFKDAAAVASALEETGGEKGTPPTPSVATATTITTTGTKAGRVDQKRRRLDTEYTKEQIEKWEQMYTVLVQYTKDHGGSTVVPQKSYTAHPKLGSWVHHQREKYKVHELSAGRIARLNTLDFVWKVRDRPLWADMYAKLVAYKAEHGHCRVPRNYVHDKALSLWVMSQRTRCTTATRRQQLTDLDFVWKIRSKTNKTKTKKNQNTTNDADGNTAAKEAVMTSWTNDKRTTADEHTHANDTNTNEDNKKRKTSTDGITNEDDDDTTTTAKKKPKKETHDNTIGNNSNAVDDTNISAAEKERHQDSVDDTSYSCAV